MTARFEALPFQPPSQALLEMLAFMEECRRDIDYVCGLELQHEESLTLSELTPRQVDRLLTWGRL